MLFLLLLLTRPNSRVVHVDEIGLLLNFVYCKLSSDVGNALAKLTTVHQHRFRSAILILNLGRFAVSFDLLLLIKIHQRVLLNVLQIAVAALHLLVNRRLLLE